MPEVWVLFAFTFLWGLVGWVFAYLYSRLCGQALELFSKRPFVTVVNKGGDSSND